jgi:hypothetical protein
MPALKIKHSDRTAQGTVGEATLQIPEPERSFETVAFGSRSAAFIYPWIQVQADADCYIRFSADAADTLPATAANCFWFPANATLVFNVVRGNTLHVIPA